MAIEVDESNDNAATDARELLEESTRATDPHVIVGISSVDARWKEKPSKDSPGPAAPFLEQLDGGERLLISLGEFDDVWLTGKDASASSIAKDSVLSGVKSLEQKERQISESGFDANGSMKADNWSVGELGSNMMIRAHLAPALEDRAEPRNTDSRSRSALFRAVVEPALSLRSWFAFCLIRLARWLDPNVK